MLAALLANKSWLDEELPTFQHLAVSLMDEQVRVVEVVPDGLPLEDSGDLVDRISWSESRWPLINLERLTRLEAPLRDLGIDVIHALDSSLWRAALVLAERLGVPAVLGADSAGDLREAEKIAARINPQLAAIVAATGPLASALRQRIDASVKIETIPPGVHAVDEDEPPRFTGESLCVIVAGSGRADPLIQALLEGIAEFVEEQPAAQFFFDGQQPDQHQIWKAGSRLHLLANMSLIPRRLGHRELLTSCDLFCHPQPLGRERGIVLRSMAAAAPIVAQADPWVEYLIDGETAWLLDGPSRGTWTDMFRRAAGQRDAAVKLGRSARAWVRQYRPAVRQFDAVRQLYSDMVGESIKFPDGTGG